MNENGDDGCLYFPNHVIDKFKIEPVQNWCSRFIWTEMVNDQFWGS